MNWNLASELAHKLPTVDAVWTFSSPPGWYLSADESEMPVFWDGSQMHDPAGEFQERITELLIPHLEEMFKQGFLAGAATAQQNQDVVA
ncbi:hypothetical protein ACXPWS_09170 [Mycobacterium sp. BMJ-28]